jgi:hypothetical protein
MDEQKSLSATACCLRLFLWRYRTGIKVSQMMERVSVRFNKSQALYRHVRHLRYTSGLPRSAATKSCYFARLGIITTALTLLFSIERRA